MIFTSLLQTVEVFFKLFSQQASQMFKNLIITWIIPSILDGEVGITTFNLSYSLVAINFPIRSDLFRNQPFVLDHKLLFDAKCWHWTEPYYYA